MRNLRFLVGLALVGVLLACSPTSPPTSPSQPLEPSPTIPLPSATALPPTDTPLPPTDTPLPPPTSTPTPNIPPWPLLQRGAWGQPEVFALQRLLRHHGFTVIADGKFGGQTLDAVVKFQASNGLPADGLVGQVTWSALVQDVLIEEGQTGEAVRAVQYLLQFKFGYLIEVDGDFGAETTDALKDFQASNNLTPNGQTDPLTWQALIAIEP